MLITVSEVYETDQGGNVEIAFNMGDNKRTYKTFKSDSPLSDYKLVWFYNSLK